MMPTQDPEKNIVIVSGPAGSGKDTLIDFVLATGEFEKIITSTTRPKREREQEGVEYYFLSSEIFEERIKNNLFLEYSQNENGAYYGVQLEHLERATASGKKLIWKVDWKGVLNTKKLFPGMKSICIMANRETLAERVRSREGSLYTESYFQERALYAEEYFTHLDAYDYVIWNENGTREESTRQFTELITKIASS